MIPARFHTAFSDERRLDAVEQLIPLAEEAGVSMPHHAMAFAICHPGVTSALLGARTMDQLDDLLAGVDTVLSDEVLDRIDAIVPPGTDIGTLDQAYVPPAIQKTELRRRPLNKRSAAAFLLPTPARTGPPKDRAFTSEAGTLARHRSRVNRAPHGSMQSHWGARQPIGLG